MKTVNTFENFLNERSINKISKDLEAVATEMVKTVGQWKAAKGDKKAELLEVLRELNKEKAELEKELDSAVAGKDRNIQLILTEEVEAAAHFENEVRDILDEAKYNKKKLLKAIKNKDDMFIQLGDGTELIVYNPDSNNKDNAEMWHDDSVFAVDQDGEEHEVKYSDIAGIGESVINEKDDVATHLDNFEDIVGKARDFFAIGKELDKGGYKKKYFYSDTMAPSYTIEVDGFKFAIINKKYVDKGDREVGDIAIGLLENLKIDEAKFVKDFDKDVLDAETKADVTTHYPSAQFFPGKTTHFFGELEPNLFFKAYYAKYYKEDTGKKIKGDFKITTVYSEKGSKYVNLYAESVVNEGKRENNKVTTAWKKTGVTDLPSIAKMYADAMQDANFHREIPTSKAIGAASKAKVKRLGDMYTNISTAAGWSGYAIANGTVQYLKHIGEEGAASKLLKAITKYDLNESVEVFEEALNERRIQIKRKYTENHPALTAGKTARVRNKILEYISDGKLTQEEFNKILSELSLDSKRWLKRNQKYFNVSEEGISLSKFGKRILKGITINENQNTKDMKIFTTFKDYLFESESVDEKYKISKSGTKKAAELLIKALVKVDKKDYEITKGSLEEGGFDLDQDKDEFGGGSYFIGDNGEIVNAADSMKIYGNVEDSVNDIVKNLKSGKMEIYESAEEADYDMLLEAIKSTKLARIMQMSNDKELFKKVYQMSKTPIDKIGDENITEIDPEKAYKEKYDDSDVVIFYISTREKENPYKTDHGYSIPANAIIGVTDGNRKIYEPVYQRWDADPDYSKGVKPESRRGRRGVYSMSAKERYPKAGASSPGSKINLQGSWSFNLGNAKRIASVSDVAYVVYLSAVPSARPLRDERAKAKEGAIAFEHPNDFKKANIDRYKMILAKRADKPEKIDKDVEKTIEASHKLFAAAFKKKEMNQYGYLVVGKDPRGRDVTARDITSFVSSLMDDWQRYSEYHANAKKEEEQGRGGSSYYKKEAKSYALSIKKRLNKFAKMDIAW